MPVKLSEVVEKATAEPPMYQRIREMLHKLKPNEFLTNDDITGALGCSIGPLNTFAHNGGAAYRHVVSHGKLRVRYWGSPESIARLKKELSEKSR